MKKILLIMLMALTGSASFGQTEIVGHNVQFDSPFMQAKSVVLGTTNVDLGNDTNRMVIACSNDAPALVQWYKSDSLSVGAGIGNVRFFAGVTNPVQVAAVSANAVSTNSNAASMKLWTKSSNGTLSVAMTITENGEVVAPSLYEYTNKSFTVTNGAPVGELQSFLDGLRPTWRSNITVTVYVTGTNTWSTPVTVSNFTGRGATLVFQGNVVSNAWHTNQTSVVDGSAGAASVFQIYFNDIDVRIQNLKILHNSTNAAVACNGIYVANNRMCRVLYCMIQGNGAGSGSGANVSVIRTEHNLVGYNMVNNAYYGFVATDSSLYLESNTNFFGNTGVGITSLSGSVYRNGSQPTGTVVNTWTLWGGQIY